ncbi:conserved Plasmodium protein, unknown function [Plasmodium gallinaceum]|uniref:Uncharacterized protein n=1 Tax=Plasmodium gallinaceum TaxID=5849 RepID=A0A1J1GZ37_PLAGA|nr:conserved Plasmodium protein, unknown function [Plasmodium gallinaceum]CRG97725.1 conserved Plasmodium protein, unknown function [Plasmodium gallinaceum]
MKKLYCEIFKKKNNFFLNNNSYLNYGINRIITGEYVKFYTKRDFLKLRKFNYKNLSTFEKNKINVNKKEDINVKEYNYSKKMNIKENMLKNESYSKKENLDKNIVEKKETLNEDKKEKKEKEKKNDLIKSLSEEFGYKYEKHEPTMFGDWSHNCRVTDF